MPDRFSRKRLPGGKGVDIFKNGQKVGHAATDKQAMLKIERMKAAGKGSASSGPSRAARRKKKTTARGRHKG